jgi:putative transposase
VIRKAVKKRKLFPTDDSAMKVVYLAIREASKKVDYAYPELESGAQPVYDRL